VIDKLPEPLAATLEDWESSNKVQGLWARDASLWTDADEGKWLGWLGIVDEQVIPVPGRNCTFGIVKAA
jgi:transaldolase / glucose-6-phosphate isomerase